MTIFFFFLPFKKVRYPVPGKKSIAVMTTRVEEGE
jgi:hypothetical protein